MVDLLAGLESRSDIPIALSMSAWHALATAAAGATRAERAADDLGLFPGLIEIVLGSLTAGFCLGRLATLGQNISLRSTRVGSHPHLEWKEQGP